MTTLVYNPKDQLNPGRYWSRSTTMYFALILKTMKKMEMGKEEPPIRKLAP